MSDFIMISGLNDTELLSLLFRVDLIS